MRGNDLPDHLVRRLLRKAERGEREYGVADGGSLFVAFAAAAPILFIVVFILLFLSEVSC